MSRDFTTVPVVDVGGLASPDLAQRKVAAAGLVKAATDVGFLYVTGHGIPQPAMDGLLACAKALFALPREQKMALYIGNSTNHRGYVPEGEEGFYGGTQDAKEAFDTSRELPADDPDYVAGNPFLGPNQWPPLPGFGDTVSTYYEAAMALGMRILRGFALGLGMHEHAFDHLVTKPTSQLRLIHYPPQPEAVDRPGIGAHTDYEMFTLLFATTPGLEVLNDAGTWIDAPPIPGAIVLNIGDMLEALTNGAMVATSHRVRKVREERYSFPLFFACDYEAKVEPLPQFTADTPPRYPTIVAGHHLLAQTAQTFTYLRQRVAEGRLAMPDGALGLSSFGQEAKQGLTGDKPVTV
ncbi:isopenicillin N synthase family dioxygenase [Zavarzinia sp. CC-PAN008]|uniref:isopenicillin N synthase family dioxygenase n=1 Tax=Zavarzinia sp. CC-PAN008 TaxID=3243332 RepID=UPI003F744E0F